MREDWIEVELGEICEVNMGQSPPSSTYNNKGKGLPFFQGKAEFTELYPVVEKWCDNPKKIAKPCDILLSVRAPVGATNIANVTCAIGRGLATITYKPAYKFLWYYFKYIEKKLDAQGTGTTFKAISGGIVRAQIVPLPPLPEQRAIITKIEELFSELDNGVVNLLKAKEKLEIYRQAVLKKAFEGELTKDWREKQLDLISVEELQREINSERKKYIQKQNEKWENDIFEWEEGGKVGSKPSKPRLREFSSKLDDRDIADLARLPESWFYNYLAYAGDLGRGKSKHRPRNDERLFGGDYPFIQTAEVRAQDLITEYTQTYSNFGLAQSKLWSKGTLCITIAANIAETGFLGIDACFPDSVVGFTPFETIIDKRYIDYFFKFAKRKISAWAPATAQKNINLNILENIIMPFCSITEQKQVVMEIEARLSVCDNIQTNIDYGLNTASALRQSILKRAFEGELLSEAEIETCKKDPTWEPAEKLLDKIRNELREVK